MSTAPIAQGPVDVNVSQLLPCPFCGGKPEMRVKPAKESFPDAWAYVNCGGNWCDATPHVGKARSVGYYKQGTLDFVWTKSDEDAQKEAIAAATEAWNKRANAELTGARSASERGTSDVE